jgi:GTP-binding protein EngB required for normal cell division/uncharacterized protein (DUF697 family)
MNKFDGIDVIIKERTEEYEKIKNSVVNIAIAGQSGVGKSSLINAIIGKKIAKVGSVETTKEIIEYDYNGLIFSDLPGCGTSNFPKEDYFEKVKIYKYDAIIVVTANRFYENDLWLIKEAIKLGKFVYVVRTKLDESINNEFEDNGLTENEVLDKISKDLSSNLSGVDHHGIYLTSSRRPTEYYLPKLLSNILSRLDSIKKQKFIWQAAILDSDILNQKIELGEKIVSQRAWAAAANGINPIPGVDVAIDVTILINLANEIKKLFGLDEAHFKGNSPQMIAAKQRIIQFTAQFAAKEGVLLLLKKFGATYAGKEISKYIPFVGQIVAASIGYYMTNDFGQEMLNNAKEISSDILKNHRESISQVI